MTDADAGDMVSKETVEKLKAELQEKSEEASKLRAFKDSVDEKHRDTISKLQPDIQSFVEEIVSNNADHAHDMSPLVEWGKSCHQSKSLETAMPLARLLSCASAQFKRTREEASVLSDTAGTLGATMKELEEAKADVSAKAQRIAELESLCNDRQQAAEKLQDELAKAGILKDKYDFSKLSSREESADKMKDVTNATANVGLVSKTSKASRGAEAHSMEDELLKFVRNNASHDTSHRIRQSGTGHAHVGTSGGSNSLEDEIASAFAF